MKIFANLANSVADLLARLREGRRNEPIGKARRRILVVGGGPVGLAFATSLHELVGHSVDITVADGRWVRQGGRVRWRDVAEGVYRREQVVTIQTLVSDRLPASVRSAMFPSGGYCEIWPTGRESPRELGFPRNVRIRELEDRLLELAHAQGLRLLAKRIDPAQLEVSAWDLIVIADGANSIVRDHFVRAFGRADATAYSLRDQQIVDTVLGVRIRSLMSSPSSVVMTIAQQRYLLNAREGDGLLYIRLTDQEAAEVRGRVEGEYEFRPCIQSNPCQVTWRADRGHKTFICSRRNSVFVPANDPQSFLWPRVLQGLRLFDIPESSIESITTFPLSMARRGAFTAELSPTGSERAIFGALIGDAAGVTHFWPGRGLNRGLSSAYALAVVLSRVDSTAVLRSADLAEFEGIMAQLQSRHQDRAWRAMVQKRGQMVLPVKSVIADAISGPRPSRESMILTMRERIETLSAGLEGRLPQPADQRELFAALERVDDETLAVICTTGPWETRQSGGPEIDVQGMLRVRQGADAD